MFHVKHFLLCDLARRRKGFFMSRFTGNRTVENCESGWLKRRNRRQNGRWQGVGCTKGRKRFPGTWENIAAESSFRAGRRTVRARWCCWEKGLSGTGCGSIHFIASRGKMFHVEHCGIFMAPAQEDRNRRGPLLAAGRGSPFWRRQHSRREMALESDRRPFWRGR